MTLSGRFKMLLMSLWIHTVFLVFTQSKNSTVSRVSKQVLMLLKEEREPKCFTRTGSDFTCFFESADNRTYDLFYRINSVQMRCETSVGRTEEGTFLHICLFPAWDVFLFIETHLEVVDVGTNSSRYSRIVSVEDHFLLNPPTNVSLHQHDGVGQLMVSWHADIPTLCADVMYMIRCSSKSLGVKTEEVNNYNNKRVMLDSLIPGEETEVQVTVKCSFSPALGHWSSWSHPVQAIVPQFQRTEDNSLVYLILCVPVSMLITAVFVISAYLSKLKHYFWPPVPNLDKVFQGFLSEIQRQTWDPPLPLKQCPEESATSIVEIISGDGVSASTILSEKSTQPVPLEGALVGQTAGEAFTDYVTLNTDSLIVCSKRNDHEYEKILEAGESSLGAELLQCSCSDVIDTVTPCYSKNFINCSYLPVAFESGLFGKNVISTGKTGNVYTNLPSADISFGPC